MVEDYIKIPEWVEDIERIFSLNFISSGMKEFVHESKVKNTTPQLQCMKIIL